MANVADSDFREKLVCRRSGRLCSPAILVTSELGTGLTSVLSPIDEALESDGMLTEDGDASMVLMKDSVSLIGGSESSPGNDRVLCAVADGSIVAEGSIDSEESGNVSKARDPVDMVSYPLSPTLAADSIEDRSSTVIVSLVGDSVEAVKELDDPEMGVQQVPVGGQNEVVVSLMGGNKQLPSPTRLFSVEGCGSRLSWGSEERRHASPSVSELVLDWGRDSDWGMASWGRVVLMLLPSGWIEVLMFVFIFRPTGDVYR
ncbi:hypothetical protein Dimus_003417 [Dionaea muscipula]